MPDESLPLSAELRIDAVCQSFEAAWKAGGADGPRPRIEDYLGSVPGAEQGALLGELLKVELHYRRAEHPAADEYRRRFPGHAGRIAAVFGGRAAVAEPPPPAGSGRETVRAAAAQGTGHDPNRTALELPPETPEKGRGTAAPAAGLPAVSGYEVLGVLGRGGMGVVYRARDKQLNRLVALKMLSPGGGARPEQLARLLIEAQAVARLDHANVVQVYETGEQNGLPYFSLELCEGGSLAAKLGGRPLPPQEAAHLVETLARAMQAAHERGIIHRDLKPANVLFTGAGQAKISDFGLAKMLDAPAGWTASGAILGTPSYMAPEQAAGKTAQTGPAADVYALGAVLYECLTGRPPFRAATPLDTVLQVLSQQPLPPRFIQRKLPRDLESICLKCLEKEPAKRYGSAAALADDLHHFLAGEPIRAQQRLAGLYLDEPVTCLLVGVLGGGLVGVLMGVLAGGLAGALHYLRSDVGIKRTLDTLPSLIFAHCLCGCFIGSVLGGMAGAWHTWCERRRLRRRKDTARVSRTLSRALPPPLPTREPEVLPPPPAKALYLAAETGEERSPLPVSRPSPSVAAPPAGAPAVPGYELLGLLGRGGMGVVYRARHVQLRRVVALKMIRAGSPSGGAARERFHVEARSAARLHHPNIVRVYESGEWDGQPYAALEYVAGGSLAHQLAGRPLPAQQAAELLETLARAVDIAHRNGVIHRDLKPANVLLAEDGTPKIADFGLAKLVDEQAGLTPTDAVLGTPSYMAPEQASGQVRHVGPAADIYALGATLYEVLTGRPPFRAATALETLKRVCLREPVPPTRLEPSVPPALEAVCLKCLAKEPGQRYASAGELANDLRRFRQGQPTRAQPPVRWKKLLREFWAVVLLVLSSVLFFIPHQQDLAQLVFLTMAFVAVGTSWAYKESRLARGLSSYGDFPFVPIRRSSDGRVIVQLGRLRFPPAICSDCCAPTPGTLITRYSNPKLKLAVPLCNACRTRLRRRNLLGAILIGVGISEATVLYLGLLILLPTDWATPEQVLKYGHLLGLLLLPFGVLAGYILAARATAPVRLGRYSALDGTIEVRFRSAEYAEEFVAGIRGWEKRIQ